MAERAESKVGGGWLGFEMRDVVFAAITAGALLVVGMITVPLVLHIPIPGIRNVASAPLSAIFLTIAVARVGRVGTILLVHLLLSFVYVLISPVIPAFLLTAALVTELVALLGFRGYRSKASRLVCVPLFYVIMTPVGTLFGAILLGGEYLTLLGSAPLLLGITAVVGALTFGATLIGEKIVSELRRAGKLR
jgi:energy-coupling factor transport system substrate-specific component